MVEKKLTITTVCNTFLVFFFIQRYVLLLFLLLLLTNLLFYYLSKFKIFRHIHLLLLFFSWHHRMPQSKPNPHSYWIHFTISFPLKSIRNFFLGKFTYHVMFLCQVMLSNYTYVLCDIAYYFLFFFHGSSFFIAKTCVGYSLDSRIHHNKWIKCPKRFILHIKNFMKLTISFQILFLYVFHIKSLLEISLNIEFCVFFSLKKNC